MPTISMFYGIIIYMYYSEEKHHIPHLHAYYREYEVVVNINNGKVLEGEMPNKQKKLLFAWIEIHKDELLANYEIAKKKGNLYKIEPLK